MLVGRGCEVAGDKVEAGGHGAGMRWVLMLIVVLVDVMGGEAVARSGLLDGAEWPLPKVTGTPNERGPLRAG